MSYGQKNKYLDKYAPVKEALTVKRAELKKLAEDNFKEQVKGIFAARPGLRSFAWNQYTPYWCDGDPCEFGVNSDYIEINEYDEDDDKSNQDNKELLNKDERADAADEVAAFLAAFEDQDLLLLFGDHAEVTVRWSGTPEAAQVTCIVESYEHE